MSSSTAFVAVYRKSGTVMEFPCASVEILSRERVSQMPMDLVLTMQDETKQRMHINPREVEVVVVSPTDAGKESPSSGASSSRSWGGSPSLG